MNTTEDNPDDEFLRIMGDIEIEIPTDVTDVSTLSDVELMNLFQDVREKLGETEEMYSDLQHTFGTKDSTREGRDLHAVRLACLVELRKRKLV